MATIPEISPTELKSRLSEFEVVDVRRPDEFIGELGHISSASLCTLETDFDKSLPAFDKSKAYAFICRSGARSGRATEAAIRLGFTKVYNMTGGMIAWNEAKLPVDR